MKCRQLGRTELQVSEIGVGAWQLGGPLVLDGKADGHPDIGRECAVALIRAAGELGINFIDTAEQYGNGESERRVGEALAGQRDRWIIGTKFGAQVGVNNARVNDASAKRLPISLEGSLKRLRTDWIDVYVYHTRPDRGEAEQVARLLESAKRKGQVRAVGISTNDLDDVKYLHSLGCLDVVQYAANMVWPADDLRQFLCEHRIGGVVRGVMAAGRLSGRYFHTAPQFAGDDVRRNWFDARKLSDEYMRFSIFDELTTPIRSVAQSAIRYVLDLPGTNTIILGAKSIEQYRNAIAAAEVPPLSEAETQRIAVLRGQVLDAR